MNHGPDAVISSSTINKSRKEKRKYERATVNGSGRHTADCGTKLTIYKRNEVYLARFRFEGKQVGQALGNNSQAAEKTLRQTLCALEDSTYVPPSQKRSQIIQPRMKDSNLNFRDLAGKFLLQIKAKKGEKTKKAYLDRIRPIIEFSEISENSRRWQRAGNIDSAFVTALQSWLRATTFIAKDKKPRYRTEKTIRNILETLRGCLNWGHRPENRFLATNYINPVTKEIIGSEQSKDPCRPNPLPELAKLKVVNTATDSQLSVVALSLVLPARADELAGLCIEDVDLERKHLLFGFNNKDINFTKGKTVFRIPYPSVLDGLIQGLIARRSSGPLILRTQCQGLAPQDGVNLLGAWHEEAQKDPAKLQTPNDKKDLFRLVMRKHGGASGDYIGKIFARVAKKAGLVNVQPGFCRDSATNLMEHCGMNHLSLRYLTSHTTSDILNTYTGMEIDTEMAKYYATIPSLLSAIALRFPSEIAI